MKGKKEELTKEQLIADGIRVVRVDGEDQVWGKNGCKLKYRETCSPHKYQTNSKTYYSILMYKGCYKVNNQYKSRYKNYSVNRVIYAWYHGLTPADMEVDHIDNNPHNNNIENLQLLSKTDNLKKKRLSKNQFTYMLTEEEILAKREKRQERLMKIKERKLKINDFEDKLKQVRLKIKQLIYIRNNLTKERVKENNIIIWRELGSQITKTKCELSYEKIKKDFYENSLKELRAEKRAKEGE